MNAKIQKFAGVLMALALVTAGAGFAIAAPGSIDGSQTDASDEVYISDEKTMDSEFNASGDTTWNLTVQSVPEDADLAMNVSHDGVTYYSFSGQFDDYDDGDPDTDGSTTGEYHAFEDDELSTVPMGINENVTLNVSYWNTSAENPTPETVQVHVENTDERAVQRVTESAPFAEVETKDSPMYRPLASDYNATTVDDNVDVNGSNTTVIYTLGDSEVTDTFANATEEVDAAGAFTFMMASTNGDSEEVVPVWYKSAPDWYDASDYGSYATYHPSEDKTQFHLSENNFDGQSQAGVDLSSDVYRVTDLGTIIELNGGYTSSNWLGPVTQMVM